MKPPGEVVDAGPLIGYLLDLVADLSTDLMTRCWQPASFDILHRGTESGSQTPVDGRGRRRPVGLDTASGGRGVCAVADGAVGASQRGADPQNHGLPGPADPYRGRRPR